MKIGKNIETRLCLTCRQVKPICEFSYRNRLKKWRMGHCKVCCSLKQKTWYKANKSTCRGISNKWCAKRRFETAVKILEYLQLHPCVDCGESDPLVLDFDHRRDKYRAISKMILYFLGHNERRNR
jgi:hypothetical protein